MRLAQAELIALELRLAYWVDCELFVHAVSGLRSFGYHRKDSNVYCWTPCAFPIPTPTSDVAGLE